MTEQKRMLKLLDLPADAPEGSLLAVVSTFGIRDHDGDVVLPSAWKDGQELPLCWAHSWDRPIGKGKIIVEPDRALFAGQFFLDTADGLNSYRTVRAMGNLQEYSYGFGINPGGAKIDTTDGEITRTLSSLTIYECSPVLKGASIGTHTIGVKGIPEGLKLNEEHALVLLANQAHVDRLKLHLAWLAERKDGRVLSAATRARIQSHVDSATTLRSGLDEHIDDLTALLKETEPAPAAPKHLPGLAEAIRFTLAGVP